MIEKRKIKKMSHTRQCVVIVIAPSSRLVGLQICHRELALIVFWALDPEKQVSFHYD